MKLIGTRMDEQGTVRIVEMSDAESHTFNLLERAIEDDLTVKAMCDDYKKQLGYSNVDLAPVLVAVRLYVKTGLFVSELRKHCDFLETLLAGTARAEGEIE